VLQEIGLSADSSTLATVYDVTTTRAFVLAVSPFTQGVPRLLNKSFQLENLMGLVCNPTHKVTGVKLNRDVGSTDSDRAGFEINTSASVGFCPFPCDTSGLARMRRIS
jgi:hypothetical protein